MECRYKEGCLYLLTCAASESPDSLAQSDEILKPCIFGTDHITQLHRLIWIFAGCPCLNVHFPMLWNIHVILMRSTWDTISADNISKYFCFLQKIVFDVSCKLSLLETVCMICKSGIFVKNKKNIVNLSSAGYAQRVVKVEEIIINVDLNSLTLVLLNKLRCHPHFSFSANQITWSGLLL